MMLKTLFIATSILLISACAGVRTNKALDADANLLLTNKSVGIIKNKPALLLVITSSDKSSLLTSIAMGPRFFNFNGASLREKSEQILQQYSIPDPSEKNANRLSELMSAKFGTKRIEALNESPHSLHFDSDAIAEFNGKSDFVLNVYSFQRSIDQISSNSAGHQLAFTSKAKLIDVNSKKLIAESFCEVSSIKPSNFTLDELFANNATYLNKLFEQAGDTCFTQFKREMFGIQ